MNLKQFQEKYHIRRIDFDKVKPSGKATQYGTDELICPYCDQHDFCELEDWEDYLNGTPYQCNNCGKYFYVNAELSINTTCVPVEEIVLAPLTRKEIENRYEHMDICDKKGCEWDKPQGVVEYETYKQYAEPLFENMKVGDE